MRDGWERKVRSSSFFYQNMVSSARKKEQIPLFFPLRPSGPAAGTSPSLTSKVLLFILRQLGIISWRPPTVTVPSGAAQEARYPAGALGDIQAVTSSFGT